MSNRNERLSEVEGIDRSKLHWALSNAFNEAEIKLLCSDLNIEFEDIQGDQKGVTALNLIQYCERHGRIPALVDHILERRAHISRDDLLVADAHPALDLPANFEFVNRAYELDLICKPGAPRFILVDGAAGYGKTYLLHKIKGSYENSNLETWKAAYLDLKQDPVMRSEDSHIIARSQIANAIVLQFSASPSFIIPSDAGERAIISKLVPFLNRQKANVLLLWDGVEVLPRSTSVWLKHLMYELDRGLNKGQRKLRVVFSGRYVSDWGRGAPYPLKTIPLSPFNSMAVHEMIALRASAMGMQPDRQFLDDLTWQVLNISGGHPQGICSVLDKITEVGFIFQDIEFSFFRDQFQNGQQTGTLFQICIEPIIKTLINGLRDPLPQALSEVFRKLSPVRRFDLEILDYFLQEKLLTAPEYNSSWELIRDMLRTRLISPPTANDPMFSDQIVRRILAMQIQLNDSDFFNKMNTQAQKLFHERACKREHVNTEVWRVAVIESLYHTLQLTPPDEQQTKLRGTLIERLKTYLANVEDPRDRLQLTQLQDALIRDVELNDLINRRTGDETMQFLLDAIEARTWA
ncbi:MAG: hypothetical protein IAE79_17345 [Anaerolinea sp.]|nr:hypothetical protein [Anaerolinea sp.]